MASKDGPTSKVQYGSHPDNWSHYRVLGVKIDADVEEIKTKYKKLALLYHPGMSSGELLLTLTRQECRQ